VRLGASTRRAADAGAPVGAVFSGVKVWDLSRRIPGAPAIIRPVTGQVVNTPVVFIQWRSEPHTSYQARVNSVNDPDSAIEWDSGEAASELDFAWSAPLPD
jgi:hypothetical protein